MIRFLKIFSLSRFGVKLIFVFRFMLNQLRGKVFVFRVMLNDGDYVKRGIAPLFDAPAGGKK
jgi:hypothetical protein